MSFFVFCCLVFSVLVFSRFFSDFFAARRLVYAWVYSTGSQQKNMDSRLRGYDATGGKAVSIRRKAQKPPKERRKTQQQAWAAAAERMPPGVRIAPAAMALRLLARVCLAAWQLTYNKGESSRASDSHSDTAIFLYQTVLPPAGRAFWAFFRSCSNISASCLVKLGL